MNKEEVRMQEGCNIVGLYRQSKEKLSKDGKRVQIGLSILAQETSVKGLAFVWKGKIVKEFIELISGRKKNRPILQEALDYCRKYDCLLVIAALDRLARRAAFITVLLESKIRFRVAQYPDIDPKENPFFFQILAAVGELEVKFIRERTKEALAAAKRRGVVLGKFGSEVLSKRNKERSLAFTLRLNPIIIELQEQGFKTIRELTDEFNRRKIPTYYEGHKWHPATVHKVIKINNQINNQNDENKIKGN